MSNSKPLVPGRFARLESRLEVNIFGTGGESVHMIAVISSKALIAKVVKLANRDDLHLDKEMAVAIVSIC